MRVLRKKRPEDVGAARLALVEPHLLPDERVLHNVPAELATTTASESTYSQPAILFATTERLIAVPYTGKRRYEADPSAPYPVLPIEYGQMSVAAANRKNRRRSVTSAVGVVVLLSADAATLPESTMASLIRFDEALATSRMYGRHGEETIERVLFTVLPTPVSLLIVHFPTYTEAAARFMNYVTVRSIS